MGFSEEQSAWTLYDVIMNDPRMFSELICLAYSSDETTAKIAWRILRNCRRLPGSRPDNTIDPEALIEFIEKTRELCQAAGKLTVCDLVLGEIMSYSPVGSDGVWPCEPVREVLDRPELERMRRGFQRGVLSRFRIFSKACYEGGDQERELASIYRNYADALRGSYPYLASALDEIAKTYERFGEYEDWDALLRLEGY